MKENCIVCGRPLIWGKTHPGDLVPLCDTHRPVSISLESKDKFDELVLQLHKVTGQTIVYSLEYKNPAGWFYLVNTMDTDDVALSVFVRVKESL